MTKSIVTLVSNSNKTLTFGSLDVGDMFYFEGSPDTILMLVQWSFNGKIAYIGLTKSHTGLLYSCTEATEKKRVVRVVPTAEWYVEREVE